MKTPSPPLSSKLLVHGCPPKPSLPCPSHCPSPLCDPRPFLPVVPIQTALCSHPANFYNHPHPHKRSRPPQTPPAPPIRTAWKVHSGCGRPGLPFRQLPSVGYRGSWSASSLGTGPRLPHPRLCPFPGDGPWDAWSVQGPEFWPLASGFPWDWLRPLLPLRWGWTSPSVLSCPRCLRSSCLRASLSKPRAHSLPDLLRKSHPLLACLSPKVEGGRLGWVRKGLNLGAPELDTHRSARKGQRSLP